MEGLSSQNQKINYQNKHCHQDDINFDNLDHLSLEEIFRFAFASLIVGFRTLSQVKSGSVARLVLQIITRVHTESRTLLVHSHFVLGVVELGLVVDAVRDAVIKSV